MTSELLVCFSGKDELLLGIAHGSCRGRRGHHLPPPLLKNQLILTEPGGADYAHYITTPQILGPSYGPVAHGSCVEKRTLAFILMMPRPLSAEAIA